VKATLAQKVWFDALGPGVERILLVSPHADDETIGAGGLLALAVSMGVKVRVEVVATPHNDYREKELDAAMKELGVTDYRVMHRGFECRMDATPQMDLIMELDRIQSDFKPDLLLLPAPSHHQDHQFVFNAGFASARQSLNPDKFFTRIVALYDYPPLQWSLEPFNPNWWVDISEVIEQKARAFSAYKSQSYPKGWANGEGVKAYAQSVGTFANIPYAEKFRILRCISGATGGAK